MVLVYLDPLAVPGQRAPQIQMLYAVDGLGQAGAHVTLITPRPRAPTAPEDILGRPLSPNVTLRHLPDLRKRWWLPSASNRPFYLLSRRALRRQHAQVILARNLRMAEELLASSGAGPLFFETHELFARTFRDGNRDLHSRRLRKLCRLEQRERQVYQQAQGLFALTGLLKNDIRQAFGISTPMMVLPDAVDLAQADEAPIPAPDAHHLSTILYLGSLHPWKGVDTAVMAMSQLAHAKLRIAGGSSGRIAELRSVAREVGAADRVEFMGPIPPASRFTLIKSADVCVLPLRSISTRSRYASPLKLFEYLAAGKPIVASDVPALREVLRPEVDALLVRPEDPAALAGAVRRILEDSALARRLGRAARQGAEVYTWKRRGERMLSFIQEQLAGARALHGEGL